MLDKTLLGKLEKLTDGELRALMLEHIPALLRQREAVGRRRRGG
jgi:hypothetical protein